MAASAAPASDRDAAAAGAADDLLAYYAKRASSYERIYHKPERQADLRAIEAWLPQRFAERSVLEIACGTGWWTPHGAQRARRWLATDLSLETLAIAQAKPMPRRADGAAVVEFRRVDAWSFAGLDAGERFDAAFAGFWWSHVPLLRLDAWLDALHARLQPGARVVLLDNAFVAGSSTPIARTDDDGNTYQRRTLDDRSVHEVLKNFPTRDDVRARLGARACEPRWLAFPHYWIVDYELAGAPPATA
jgi:SAM-dependent methyltransferase